MRVLFVDDEPNILSGLKRTMRCMRNEWEMEFCQGAEEALEKLRAGPGDVVISDMKMPVIDGARFLQAVREDYPQTIRIALSGETDASMIYRCVEHAHQYLAKPCSADTIKATVERAVSLRDLVQDEEIRKVVANVSSLPSLPEVYTKITEELLKDDPSMEKIGHIVESDIAISAKLLQIVNSSFFGLMRQVSSSGEAATYLGVDVVRSLVLTTGILSEFENSVIEPARLASIWSRGVQVGNTAQKIMKRVSADKLEAGYAMMGGMLANVGKLVIAANFPQQFADIEARLAASGESDLAVERSVLGQSHTEIGAYLLCIWGLPNPVVECAAFHHAPADCGENRFLPVAAVHIAMAIVDSENGNDLPGLDHEFIDRLGLTAEVQEWAISAAETAASMEK